MNFTVDNWSYFRVSAHFNTLSNWLEKCLGSAYPKAKGDLNMVCIILHLIIFNTWRWSLHGSQHAVASMCRRRGSSETVATTCINDDEWWLRGQGLLSGRSMWHLTIFIISHRLCLSTRSLVRLIREKDQASKDSIVELPKKDFKRGPAK